MWIQQGKSGVTRAGDWRRKGFYWPSKSERFHRLANSKKCKGFQSFLGFGNFYQKFIPKFSTLAALLNNLLKKDTVFEWTQETQQTFEELKQWLTLAPVLMMPDQTKCWNNRLMHWSDQCYYCIAETKQCDTTIWTIITVTIVLPFSRFIIPWFYLSILFTISLPKYLLLYIQIT